MSLRTAIALRAAKYWTGRRVIAGVSHDKTGEAAAQLGADQLYDGTATDRDGAALSIASTTAPIAVNDDVWRRRFHRRHGMTKLRRAWRLMVRSLRSVFAFLGDLRSKKYSGDEKLRMLKTFRSWDPDQLEEHRRKKSDDQLFRLHTEQARLIKQTLISRLTDLGFCFAVTKNEAKHVKARIKIARVDVSPYAYTYYITRVPFGVRLTEMAKDEVSTELAASIGKKIRHELDLNGLRYTVEVGSTLSVPNFVPFKDVSAMPKNMPPLAFWAGLSANGSPIYRNLADAPHMIVAGSSGGGKSNFENCIACTYLMRRGPETIRMVFFDLKGGVEFSHFEGIPHLWPMDRGDWHNDGIVEYPHDVIAALECLFDECNRRLGQLKAAKKKNLSEYNRGKHPKNRLPYIVVFFDEWASTKKLVGDKAESILSNIANLSRSAGIHFILSTQYPKAEVINTTISVNFPWRVAFAMTTGASQSVLGSWDAFGLSPTGRAILQAGDGGITVQTPRITNSTVAAIAAGAKSNSSTVGEMASVDAEEILEWAINNTGGKLSQETIWGQFKDKLTAAALFDLLRSMDNQTFEVQGTLYIVTPAAGPNPRKMELAEQISE